MLASVIASVVNSAHSETGDPNFRTFFSWTACGHVWGASDVGGPSTQWADGPEVYKQAEQAQREQASEPCLFLFLFQSLPCKTNSLLPMLVLVSVLSQQQNLYENVG